VQNDAIDIPCVYYTKKGGYIMSISKVGKTFRTYKKGRPKTRLKKSTQEIVDDYMNSMVTTLPRYFHFLNAGYDTKFEHGDYDALKIILKKVDKIYDNIDCQLKII
jgi:hypothetical protein